MTCIICAGDNAEGWTVCRPDLDRIDDGLEAILTLTRAAADHLTPEKRAQAPGGGKPGSRPPLDLAALDDAMASDALPMAEAWERIIREDHGLAPYGAATALEPATLARSVAFLRSWLARLAEDPRFPIEELAREVRETAARLSRYDAQRNPPRPGVPVSCPGDHPDADGRTCDTVLRCDGTSVVVCPRCQTHWTADTLLDAHDMDLLPAAVLILLDPDHPDPRKRIAKWAERDRLTTHATTPNPDGGKPLPLYRLGEYRNLLSMSRATEPQPDLTRLG